MSKDYEYKQPAFGSQAMMQKQRNCVVCGIDFESKDKVTNVAPDQGLYFAHREHFEEPIPEPPGVAKDCICGAIFSGHTAECVMESK